MRAARADTILLTGASGVVGHAIADELADNRTVGCVHADTAVPGLDLAVDCDLALPRFGLSEERWQTLAEETDVIVHSAALTVWGQPTKRYQAINVEGTRRVIELAQLAGAAIYLISTSFVHALERHPLDALSDTNVVKPYIHSKLQAERLLVESDVPHTIFRPTNLVGNSRTGASSRPQIVQALSDWICRGKAPYFPAHPGNLVDLVPVDLLTAAVAGAIKADDLGSEYWVTYGAEAMTVEDSLQILAQHARTLGREIDIGPVVDPRRSLPIPLEQVPATSRPFLKVLIDVSEVTHACGGVLPISLTELRERFSVPVNTDTDAYRRSLNYWAAERARAPETVMAGT